MTKSKAEREGNGEYHRKTEGERDDDVNGMRKAGTRKQLEISDVDPQLAAVLTWTSPVVVAERTYSARMMQGIGSASYGSFGTGRDRKQSFVLGTAWGRVSPRKLQNRTAEAAVATRESL
jgi:hypothetical protein